VAAMLKFLRLRGAPVFGEEFGVAVGPLKQSNFFFGPNGSGKTTISRAFVDPSRFAGTTLEWSQPSYPLGVKVYNRDYVDATLTPAGQLPGVFILGEANAEIQAEIESLTGPNGSIAAAQKALAGLQSSLDAKNRDITDARAALKDAAWAKREDVPAELREMFKGYNNNKDRFLDRLLETATTADSAAEEFTALAQEAAAIFVADAQPLAELSLGRDIRIEDAPGFPLLGVAVVGSGDVQLAPLIEQLGNADWVQHGRDYLEDSAGLCPFCQQTSPPDLGAQLEAYFDRNYAGQMEQLAAFRERFESWAQDWATYLDDLPAKPGALGYLDADRWASARGALEKAIDNARAQVDGKLSAPSTLLSIPDLSPHVAAVNAVVREANAAIKGFNNLLKNRSAAKKSFIDRCWVAFARSTLATDLAGYEAVMPGHEEGKRSIEGKVETAEADVRGKESRLRELQAKVTSSRPVIDRINRLLKSVGFESFSLAESAEVENGYTLVRSDGEIATETLSEGERTFIAFLYYYQSLQGSPQDDTESHDLLAVVDDPISSLDSEVLYSVSTLIRKIVEDIPAGLGRVRQLLLFTHNVHFHKNVTYEAHRGPKLGSRQYGIVRKQIGQHSVIELCDQNPINTAYGWLWEEVKRAAKQPSTSAVGLQNVLRRILETYFKVIGDVDEPVIVGKFEGSDRVICRSLFAWANDGSHAIFDALEYSPTSSTADANLRVFRRIFEELDHGGHYRMMMGESAAEGPEQGSAGALA